MDEQPPQEHPVVGSDGELLKPDRSFRYPETSSLEQMDDALVPDEQPLFSVSPVELLSTPAVRRTLRIILLGLGAVVVTTLALMLIITSSIRTEDNDLAVFNVSPIPEITFPLPGNPSESIRTSATSTSTLSDIEWSPDSTRLAVNNFVGRTRIWDILTGQEVFALDQQTRALAWSPDGSRLFGDINGAFAMWDTQTGTRLFTFAPTENRSTSNFVWALDGSVIATDIGVDAAFSLHSAQTGWVVQAVARNDLEIPSTGTLIWTQGGLVSVNRQGIVRWNTRTWNNETIQRFDSGATPPPSQIRTAASSDGRYLAITLESRNSQNITVMALMWDTTLPITAESSRMLTLFDNENRYGRGINELDLSPDATQFVTTDGGTIRIWDALTGTTLRVLFSEERIVDVDWSPDGRYLAVCSDYFVRIYLLENGG